MALYKGSEPVAGLSNELFNNKVSKTGDTMTGDLLINKSNQANLSLRNTIIDSSSTIAPTEWTGIAGIYLRDKNYKNTGFIENSISTTNRYTTHIGARRIINGQDKTASITLSVDENGKSIYYPYQLITSYINGTSGYNIWSNGYCEQWGRFTGSGAGISISLSKTFIDTNYIVTASSITARNIVGATALATNSITFSVGSSSSSASTNTVTWIARGYLANGQY